jgi:hypothetical protein
MEDIYITHEQSICNVFLQWDIQSTKYRLFAQSKLTKLTTDSWESLEDLKNIYIGKFSVPEVKELHGTTVQHFRT